MNYRQAVKQRDTDKSSLASYKLEYEEHRKPKVKEAVLPSQTTLDMWITLGIEAFLVMLILIMGIYA